MELPEGVLTHICIFQSDRVQGWKFEKDTFEGMGSDIGQKLLQKQVIEIEPIDDYLIFFNSGICNLFQNLGKVDRAMAPNEQHRI